MSQRLSPFATVAILEYHYSEAFANVCREWDNLAQRYIVGEPSLLPTEWLRNRALALGRLPPEEAVQIIFDGREPLTLYGTLPKWLIPTVVSASLLLPFCIQLVIGGRGTAPLRLQAMLSRA